MNILNIYIEEKYEDYYLMELTTFNMFNMNGIGNSAGLNPASNCFSEGTDFGMSAFSNPFAMASSFPGFDGDFMSTINMFSSFMNNLMPMSWQNKIFTDHFNTKTNLPQLKNVYNPNLGNSLANIANKNATQKDTRHKCLQGVRETLNKTGLVNGSMGGSAYQAAELLAHNKNFKEVAVDTKDLKNLPAGCVIVWDRNYVGTKSSDIHGHIAVTLGDGREASDHVANKTYILNSNHRVFVPVGMNKAA